MRNDMFQQNPAPVNAEPARAAGDWRRWVWGRRPRRTLLRGVILGLCCWGLFGFWLRPALTRGVSMEPTVADRSLHLLNLQAYRSREPARGDIVVVRTHGNRFLYLKRILGLPGETVGFRQGALRVDGEVRSEPYVRLRGQWDLDDQLLGPDEYFVAGDHRGVDIRSHLLGRVYRRDIAGSLLW